MLTYKSSEMKGELGADMTHSKIEAMQKVFRSHRCALEFDKAFIEKIVENSDFNYKSEVVNGVAVKKENGKKSCVSAS